MNDCLIAFGSNEGQPKKAFLESKSLLESTRGIDKVVASTPVQTKPVGGPKGQPAYLNAAFRFSTSLSASELHQRLIAIEQKLGRQRRKRWGARKIDLDLLLFGIETVDRPSLTVPHPRMSFRKFVLVPALEIAKDMLHPVCQLTVGELVEHLELSPKRIVWVTDGKRAAKKIADSIEGSLAGAGGSDWKIEVVSRRRSAKKFARLLVYDLDHPPTEYCMPELDLRDCDASRKQIEIAAAIEAMS